MKVLETSEVCPVVILKVMRLWRSLTPPSEEEIIVKSPWEAVAQELEKWCNETGNEFLGYSRDGNKLAIKLRLKR